VTKHVKPSEKQNDIKYTAKTKEEKKEENVCYVPFPLT